MDPRDAFKKFSEPAKRVLEAAEHYGDEMGQSINSEHLLLALASVPHTVAQDILRDNLINLDQIKLILSLRGPETTMSTGISDQAKEVIAIAAQAAAEFAHGHIDPEHILLGIVSLPESLAYQIINRIGANPSAIRQQLVRLFENLASADGTLRRLEQPERAFAGAATGPGTKTSPKTKTKTPALDYFTVKLTEAARDGKLDPVIGREGEIQRVMQILSRRRKNNPVLVGDPGVGKTAIVEGLAIKIAKGEVPSPLKNREIYNLDLALVVAGTTYRGQFEERLKKIVAEAKKTVNSILFIDELHTLVGAGAAEGSMDAANILKPALAKGEVRLIGATTSEEYRKYIERDAALERRLQRIGVNEPSLEQTIAILKGLRGRYEEHHGVIITDQAITSAAELAGRYIADRQQPDKAIDLVDEAAASVQLQKPFADIPELNAKEEELARVIERKEKAVEEQQFELAASLRAQELELETGIRKIKQSERNKSKLSIDEADIAKVVAQWTGIPVGELSTDERLRLRDLEEILKARVVGQNEAIEAVAKTIRRAKSGLGNPNRPIGSFVFLGPSGVGKTYLAKTLAETVYGKPEAFVKIDMSEFMERHNVSRLLGAPPGYVGFEEAGKLTEAVRRQPYSLILFDEIEKAHVDVFNILLQILEDGMLTDARGRQVNFRNTMIVMTSNIGLSELTRQAEIGFRAVTEDARKEALEGFGRMRDHILKRMKERLLPEFINRIDSTIVFKPLGKPELETIVQLRVAEVADRLTKEGIGLGVDKAVLAHIVERDYDPMMGARPLARAVTELVENPLSEQIISGKIKKGNRIKAILEKDQIVFKTSKRS